MIKTYEYKDLSDKIKYGASCHENLKNVHKFIKYPYNSSDWTLSGTRDAGALESRCACGNPIRYEYIMTHKTGNVQIIVGSICVNKYYPTMKERMKELDDHRLGRINCELCKKTITKNIVERYKTQTKKYHVKCLKTLFKWCFNCELYNGYDCVCKHCVSCERGMGDDTPAWKTQCKQCWYKSKFG